MLIFIFLIDDLSSFCKNKNKNFNRDLTRLQNSSKILPSYSLPEDNSNLFFKIATTKQNKNSNKMHI